jgi:undecaprenyl phosphate-alpha-L-ara4N flippase subunit ArnE
MLASFKVSFQKNRTGILLILVSSICVCFGQLFWKIAVTNGLLYIFLGFVLYGAGALVMLIAYRYGSLSVLQPMLSMNYVLTIVLASIILHESIAAIKIIGIIVICLGVILIGGGDGE